MSQFDVIIVGAGSAGAACAYRLANANPQLTIALVEAGGRDWHPYIHVPAAIVKLIGSPKVDWGIQADPDPTRGGKVDLWPAGKVLGGSSSINGMLYVRGAAHDYDRWAADGCDGWSFDDLLPLFLDLEASEVGGSDLRGKTGPLSIQRLRSTHPLASVFVDAALNAGETFNADYNGESQAGVAYSQATQKRGQRFSAARAFLWPGRKPSNVALFVNNPVTKLKIENQRCSGVALADGTSISAPQTVISTGAMGTPKLLMLSGIGPAAQLKEHGIDVAADVPAVGQNLQDHPEAMVGYEVRERTYNMEINSWRVGLHAVRWALTGRGPATSPYPHAVAFLKSDKALKHPDIQVQLGPYAFSFDENGVVPYHKPAVSAAVNISYPKSRGEVRLRDGDWRSKPIIDHGMFSDPDDMDLMIKACRQVRQIFQTAPFTEHSEGERLPGENIQTADEWADYIRQVAFLGYHSCGTMRMGDSRRQDVAVAADLSVKGIDGLKVADASVMPDLISGNTNATAMVIGMKAADILAEEFKGKLAA
ncbi:MAG: GMC family oxidoreductase N-terminal domain-containing protein [Pseudomonadota bacterium]